MMLLGQESIRDVILFPQLKPKKAPAHLLVIFDIDGTLCDTHDVESRCYAQAVETVTGLSLATVDWSHYPEVTSSAIARGFLEHHGVANPAEMEQRILAEFVACLEAEARKHRESFQPIAGAPEMLRELQAQASHQLAIATGCWTPSARFKLQQAGFDTAGIPFASCSDAPRRTDIIRLAANRAGRDVKEAVYVGDGPWDFKATRELGIPFIGIGNRHERLRQLGAAYALPTYRPPTTFFAALASLSAGTAA